MSAVGSPPDLVGDQVRSRRLAAGLSIAELARRCDVSAPFVSQLESGRSSLSLASLYRFATVLGCTPNALLGTESTRRHVTRAGTGRRMRASSTRRSQQPRLLSSTGAGVMMECYHYVIDPADDDQEWFEHEGEDFVYVVRGRIVVAFQDTSLETTDVELAAGDSLHHGGTVPHRWVLQDGEEAEVILSCAIPPGSGLFTEA